MSPDRPGAVVMGGDFQGLGVLVSLSKQGVRTHVVDSDLSIARFSASCDGFTRCPPASLNGGRELVRFLIELADAKNMRGWVLFPNDDIAVEVLATFRDELEPFYRVPVQELEVLRPFLDKRLTDELAARSGVPFPRTRYPADQTELPGLGLDFPVIIKPRKREPFFSRTRKKAVRAADLEELTRIWEWATSVVPASDLMVQEIVAGGADSLYSLGAYVRDGELVGRVVAHRKRQHPMDFGRATTFAETVDIPEIETLGQAVLNAAGYEGLAEVEFMLDPVSGEYKLLEVNPRVWGWHTLAIKADVDLPFMFYSGAIGEDVARAATFTRGVKWLRPITDIPTSAREILRGRLAVGAYMRSIRGDKQLAPPFSLRDPLPFLVEFLLIPYLLLKRGF